MRFVLCAVLLLLAAGCLGTGGAGNETNASGQNVTQNATNQTLPSPWQREYEGTFSFEYPAGMAADMSTGSFIGRSTFDGTTAEAVIVSWLDTRASYGPNQDEIFMDDPTKTASNFLGGDAIRDPLGILHQSYGLGDISTFSISRDAYVAELPFSFRPSGFTTAYSGHALDLYIPERSTLVRVRIIAIDPAMSDEIRDHFLLSFRVE